ncbi:MAG: hypothetical protein ABI790_08680 [Betaproteobacteria bacterium]
MNAADALAFVRERGIVLVSARGPAPRLTEAIAGETIAGSWWSHAQGRHIFTVLGAVTESDDILVCRLIGGKVTLVHRRLWPALVRLADAFAPEQLARVREEHTASGRHATHEVPYPDWVPADIHRQASRLSADAARALLGDLPGLAGKAAKRQRRAQPAP